MKIGLIFASFAGGGAERMMVNLAKGLAQNKVDVTIYVVNKTGSYLDEVPGYIPIENYNAKYGVKSVILKIRKTLKKDNLTAIISTQEHINTAVGLAALGINNRPKIIFREANTPSKHHTSLIKKIIYTFGYKQADHFVAISEGVKVDMLKHYQLSNDLIDVIYSPVIDDDIEGNIKEKPSHPWLISKNNTVIVGMGRLVPQKDFPTLFKAFKIVSETCDCKLIIFGESYSVKYFEQLKSIINELNINNSVDLAGFTNNPYAVLARSDLFAQSPQYEGFGNVLVEAMAVGCPVVSTDCPSGPREILDDGNYGKLVEVGDYKGLADAIVHTLQNPISKKVLKERANYFSVKRSANNYHKLIKRLLVH